MFQFIKNYRDSLIPLSALMEAFTPIGTVRFMKGQFGKVNQAKVKVSNAGEDGHNTQHGGWVYWISVSQALQMGIKDGDVVPVRGGKPISPEDYLALKAVSFAPSAVEPVSEPADSVDVAQDSSTRDVSAPEFTVGLEVPSETKDGRVEVLLKALSVGPDVLFKPVLTALRDAGDVGMALWEIKNLVLSCGFDQSIAAPVQKRLLNYLAQHGFGHYSPNMDRFFLGTAWYTPNKRFWDEEFQSFEPLSLDYDPLKDQEILDILTLAGLLPEKAIAFYVAVLKNSSNFGISAEKAEIQAIAHRKFVLGDPSLEKSIYSLRAKGFLVQDPETELYYFRALDKKEEIAAVDAEESASIPVSTEVETTQVEVNLEASAWEMQPPAEKSEQLPPENDFEAPSSTSLSGLCSEEAKIKSNVACNYIPVGQEQIGTLRFYPNVRGGELTHVGVLVEPGAYRYIMTVKRAKSLGLGHGDVVEFEMPAEGKPILKYDQDGKILKKLIEHSGQF